MAGAGPAPHITPNRIEVVRNMTATNAITPPETLQHAQDRVADSLLAHGLVSPEQYRAAVAARDTEGGLRGGILLHLIDAGAVAPTQARSAVEAEFGMPTIDLSAEEPEHRAVALIPTALARELGAAPLGHSGGTLQVAMRDPFDTDSIARLRGHTRLDVQPVLADEHSLWEFILRCYPGGDTLASTAGRAVEAVGEDEATLAGRRSEAVDQRVREAAVPAFVRAVLEDAVHKRASDIHFEVYERLTRVRYRIDGRLVEARRDGDPRIAGHIAGHIKYLAMMRSASDRMPQDGALSMQVDGRDIQFRVATLPTIHGETVVLRVLDFTDVPADLGHLGISGREREILERAMRAKRGMLLVTGPTGSGKSTTLAAVLTAVASTEIKVLSVEDPVERKLTGIEQVQVLPHDTNAQLDRSFAAVLRAFLRNDPDVIMVGEVRDLETGTIAVKAALTGHLVLSTLHTNSAASTLTRLVHIGIERYVIAAATRAVVAQRLVRRICTRCSESYVPDAAELAAAGFDSSVAGKEFRRGTGQTRAGIRCDACSGSGYRGRIGLFEVLAITDAIKQCIEQGGTENPIVALARADGMRTLEEAARHHASTGATSLAEVIEVVSY